MASPGEIEQNFQRLKRRLQGISSDRRRLMSIHRFLKMLNPPLDRYESYMLELTGELPSFHHPLSLAGIDPEQMQHCYDKLREFERASQKLAGVEEFQHALKRLQKVVALLFAFTGALERCLKVLEVKVDQQLASNIEFVRNNLSGKPYQMLSKLLVKCKVADHEAAELLRDLKRIWDQSRKNSEGVLIPVVQLRESSGSQKSTRLRRLKVEIEKVKEDINDAIRPRFAAVEGERLTEEFFKVPVAAARSLLREQGSRLSSRRISGYAYFELTQAHHRGRSIYLAAAGLIYAELLRYGEYRDRYRFKATTAITGDINGEGVVQPVDKESLVAKVRAVFFSWVNHLVVPSSHKEEAQKELRDLQQRFPHRRLELIGVDKLENLFRHRDITRYECVNWVRHYGRMAWKRGGKIGVGALSVLVVVLLGMYFLQSAKIVRNPVSHTVVGKHLVIKNKYGEALDRFQVGTKKNPYGGDKSYKDQRRVLYKDITGDNFNEVCWIEYNSKGRAWRSKVHCKDIRTDSLLWTHPISYNVEFPEKSVPMSDKFKARELKLFRPEPNRPLNLAVLSRHILYFPGMVEVMVAENGKRRGKYLHIGRFQKLAVTDLDQNTRKELVVVGENNAFDRAVVSVLDPDRLTGHSPLNGDYQIANMKKASEIAYWIIPPTKIGRLYDLEAHNNRALNVSYQMDPPLLKIRVSDVNLSLDVELPDENSIHYFAYHRPDFSLHGIGTSSAYDNLARRLQEEGRIKEIPDTDYFKQFGDSLRFWNGNGWQHTPMVNPGYAKVQKKMEEPAYEW